MLLSKSCEYGLRAVVFMAARKDDEYISIRDISDKLDISFHFLTKILQQLTSANMLESFRGPKGGVRLRMDASDISIKDIVEAIDGSELWTGCVLGLPGCGEKRPCPLHDEWVNSRTQIKEMLKSMDLRELSDRAVEQNLRLSDEGSMSEYLTGL
ncbi:MAG: RrF2 family transcriptional regulator [Bacteroidota bacterium]